MEQAQNRFPDPENPPSVEEAAEWLIDLIREHAGHRIPSDVMEQLRDEIRSFESLEEFGSWVEETMRHLEDAAHGGQDDEYHVKMMLVERIQDVMYNIGERFPDPEETNVREVV